MILACVALAAQQTEFEVASIRPAAPGARGVRCKGGPGTSDPGLLTCENYSLSMLVMMAYDLRPFELNAPAWMEAARFDVSARVPAGADQKQFEQMQQSLLRQRFGLQAHFKNRPMSVYDLTVAKDGPKLRNAEQQADEKPSSLWMPPPGGPPVRARVHVMRKAAPVSDLARFLSDQLNRPVIDSTGLTGRYDYQLSFVMEPGGRGAGPSATDDADFGSSLIDAVRDQLGLSLRKKKGDADVLVVDFAEKAHSGN